MKQATFIFFAFLGSFVCAQSTGHFKLNFGQAKSTYENVVNSVPAVFFKHPLIPVLLDSIGKDSNGNYIRDIRAGVTFDPKSTFYDPAFAGSQLVNNSDVFTVDSLLIKSSYQRRNNIDDTLLVEICWGDTADNSVFTKWGYNSYNEFITSKINPSAKSGNTSFLSAPGSKKIILKRVLSVTDADTSLSNPWRFTLVLDIKSMLGYALTIPAGNIVGVSCTFVPGEKYNYSDVCFEYPLPQNAGTKNGLGIYKIVQADSSAGNLIHDDLNYGYRGWNTTQNYLANHRYNKFNPLILNVLDFGADPGGGVDSRPAIQKALDSLKSFGGGTLKVPVGTYLLDSWMPSSHPWGFYNLLVGSNTTVDADTGAVFLQGPNGRHSLPTGADEVRNCVLVFGSSLWNSITFQNPGYNGGFYNLNATNPNDTAVTFSTGPDVSNFKAGDYIAIYETTTGDVLPTETNKITTVDKINGVIGLQRPLSRGFSTPSIANVTARATENVYIKNLTVIGAQPLSGTETFGFTAEKCAFVVDLSVGAAQKDILAQLNLNTINNYRFKGCSFTLTGSGGVERGIELPQRNSRYGIYEACTFKTKSMGFGEYGAHIKLVNNNIWVYPDSVSNPSIFLGGLDVDFSYNNVHTVGNITAINSGGWGALIVDVNSPAYYLPYTGQIKITHNKIDCRADGNSCIVAVSPDPVIMNNDMTISGTTYIGIRSEGNLQSRIEWNNISGSCYFGILSNTGSPDASIISNNTMTGSGNSGIFIPSPGTPSAGGDTITNNSITGYTNAVSIDLSEHPGTLISATAYADKLQPKIYSILTNSITTDTTEVNWTTDELADSQVEYGLSNSYGQTTTISDPNGVISHFVQLGNLLASTTYHYRIKSKDPSGNLSVSADKIFKTPISMRTDFFDYIHSSSETEIWDITTVVTKGVLTGNKELITSNTVHVSPNPTNGNTIVNYNLANAGKVTLQVTDYTGKELLLIHEENKNPGQYSLQLNTDKLEPGIYFCTLITDHGRETQKLVVIK